MTTAKGTGYVKGSPRAVVKKLVSHVKYLEHRPRGAEETRADRTFFSAQRDAVGRHEVIDDIMDHTLSRVSYHKIVLSPSKEEVIADWREWTRGVLRDLERFKGLELHWYAVKHSNTDDPHIHVVLAGSGENMTNGRRQAVLLHTQDYAFLRERGRERSGYDFDHQRQDSELVRQIDQELERLDPYTRSTSRSTERDTSRSRGIDR